MDGFYVVRSKRLQLAGALVYATVMVAGLVGALGTSALTAPLLFITLGAPLIFRLVPRNYLYGMRSPRTLWTDDATWYRQNVITGAVMVIVGVTWLAVIASR